MQSIYCDQLHFFQESQTRHVMRFVETEKHLNNAYPLRSKLEKTKKHISTALYKYMAGQLGSIQIAE